MFAIHALILSYLFCNEQTLYEDILSVNGIDCNIRVFYRAVSIAIYESFIEPFRLQYTSLLSSRFDEHETRFNFSIILNEFIQNFFDGTRVNKMFCIKHISTGG